MKAHKQDGMWATLCGKWIDPRSRRHGKNPLYVTNNKREIDCSRCKKLMKVTV